MIKYSGVEKMQVVKEEVSMSAIEIILGSIVILSSIVVIVVVLMQQSREAGLSGAISGAADTSSVRIRAELLRLSSKNSQSILELSSSCLFSLHGLFSCS